MERGIFPAHRGINEIIEIGAVKLTKPYGDRHIHVVIRPVVSRKLTSIVRT